MTIPFNNIPSNLRVPLFYAEVDNSMANSGQTTYRALIIGQKTEQGGAKANVPVISQGVSDAIAQGGEGSILGLMVEAYRANDSFGELWTVALEDDASSIAAKGSISIESSPTETGVIFLYIGGKRITQKVLPEQSTETITTNLAKAINDGFNLPVTATAETNKVVLTAVNKGACGNDIDLRLNYRGKLGNEVTPQGLSIVIGPMAGGKVDPDLTEALSNLNDTEFDFIACPYTDSGSLDTLKAFLNDQTGRWSWSSQLYGHYYCVRKGTLGELTTFGSSRNDQHGSVMGVNNSPTPPFVWAAALTATAANSIRVDPARPLQTLTISGVLAPVQEDRFELADRNVLLWDGISTFMVADDGSVAIENLITTYQKNKFGQADDSYLQVETMYTLSYVIRRMRAAITSKYARMKLADNGTRFAPGSAIVTPNVLKAELISQYAELEYEGYVQGRSMFKEGLIVERNATNPNRIDVLWPGALINQLRIFALLAQFRLSTNEG